MGSKEQRSQSSSLVLTGSAVPSPISGTDRAPQNNQPRLLQGPLNWTLIIERFRRLNVNKSKRLKRRPKYCCNEKGLTEERQISNKSSKQIRNFPNRTFTEDKVEDPEKLSPTASACLCLQPVLGDFFLFIFGANPTNIASGRTENS